MSRDQRRADSRTQRAGGDVELALTGEPASARAARRVTSDALRAWQRHDLEDTATLVVSELVTNAILHAGTELSLRLSPRAQGVYIEVRDASPVLPVSRDYREDATTGRGLGLVELLASKWGADHRPDGKIVWAEIGGTAGPAPHEEEPVPDAPAQDSVSVTLLDLPPPLYDAVQQHNDALLRELALSMVADRVSLAEFEQAAVRAAHAHLAQLNIDMAPDGRATVAGSVPAQLREDVVRLMVALDDADALAERGQLLIPSALPELRALRRWIFGQVLAQLDGEQPTPWRTEELRDQPVREFLATMEPEVVLGQLADAVVVADDSNRIAYVNPAAERLLQWPAAALTGQRLVVIVPERLRDAHVAGYSRFLLTREARLVGKPAQLPVRRRDGSEAHVELVLSTVTLPGGRPAFIGSMREQAAEARTSAEAMLGETMAGVAAVVRNVADRGEPIRDETVLTRLAAGGHWRFAALWRVAGNELRCKATWSAGDRELVAFERRTAAGRFEPGVGLPGRAWQANEPAWVVDVVADANFPRARAALDAGLRSALAFPLRVRGEAVGVIELYAREVVDEHAMMSEFASTAGDVIGLLLSDAAAGRDVGPSAAARP